MDLLHASTAEDCQSIFSEMSDFTPHTYERDSQCGHTGGPSEGSRFYVPPAGTTNASNDNNITNFKHACNNLTAMSNLESSWDAVSTKHL